MVSSTNKTDCQDIAEILLKVAINTIAISTFTIYFYPGFDFFSIILPNNIFILLLV
jgi:hypothetical protein